MEFKNNYIEGNHDLPDGTLFIEESNKKKFKYLAQVNNQPFYQYHKMNGITQTGLIKPGSISETGDSTTIINTPVEGML